ncbi:hypothetical protein [Arthrobacter sp. zg-Y1143]|uniref:hypothetical protein n=1 Tax=Arthrobacter sp. zg-Y1143 TaxID=3049065 RepID=UPI0024C42C0E|nr:hypothetical protein [Arthrobacter sp. zg-Y1143]MDK1327197.1 hypothetical protein [Arthrobacter sp. zg-Y1143]
MQTVRDVLGPDCRKPFVSLIWEGRNESAFELSARIMKTLVLVSSRFPESGYRWFRGPADVGEAPTAVPNTAGELAGMVADSFDLTMGSYFSQSSLSLFLLESPTHLMDVPSAVTVAAGSGNLNSNRVTVDLPEDFPLGSPSDAARLFLDLVRIWQPDSAKFITASAARATMGRGYVSHAAYLSWTSANAHSSESQAEGELVIPFGEGLLYVARTWTIPAIVALHEELDPGRTGAPEVQDPPYLPDGYPLELDQLDSGIVWGASSGY